MFSTVITVIDGFPRVYANVTERLFRIDPSHRNRLYLAFLFFQAIVALVLLSLLFSSFGVFIDFATTAGFVTAPVIAILNHRVIGSAAVPVAHRPAPWLKVWSAVGIVVLTSASLTYLYFRFL
jgi:Mn2+/Fe2+ NRAMP family transporter